MSDPSDQNQSPNSSGRQPGEPNRVNWPMFVLFAIASVVLGIAILYPFGQSSVTNYTYAEFRKAWDQGRVVVDDPKMSLKVLTSDNQLHTTVEGWVQPERVLPKGEDKKIETLAFRVPVNLELHGEVLKDLLGEKLKTVTTGDELPAVGEQVQTLTLAELRRAIAMGEVQKGDAANPVVLHVRSTGNEAVVTGVRQVVTNLVPKKDEKTGKEAGPTPFRVKVYSLAQSEEIRSLVQDVAIDDFRSNYFQSTVLTFLPFLLVVLVLFFIFRQQMRAAGRGAMSFGKSKARLLTMDRNKVTFKDVAGIQEAKEELFEIVDFLKDPRKFQKLGGSIPKGVLMVGAPGTGKTLLARAIAGEADVPFFSISGSDFVEMFVGVGASRVRDMFEQGKKHAPCLIFIDEIDAVGRHRGHGMGGGHDEREQTLNQLLVEMDGFDTQEGVIIIAATNRPDVLDPALLRPGRFDRQVTVALPDVNGREEILKVHVKKIKLAAGVDLSKVAKGTPGFSGAELANLVNEAALLAARRGLNAVTLDELEEARDKVRWGRERRSLAMSDKEKVATAWHEAGHAILLAKLENAQPLHKVTIIPRGPSLGSTMWLPEGDRYCKQLKEAADDLAVAVAGRIAESFYTSDISSGAAGDIRMATNLARTMVCVWGMSDKLGMIEYGDDDSPRFLARDMGRSRNYSEETARLIDAEIKRLVDDAFERATAVLTQHRDKVEILAKALLEYETLDADHVREILEFGELRNPPNPPTPPPVPEEARKAGAKKSSEERRPEGDGPIPGTVGATA